MRLIPSPGADIPLGYWSSQMSGDSPGLTQPSLVSVRACEILGPISLAFPFPRAYDGRLLRVNSHVLRQICNVSADACSLSSEAL
jgi:hypothetical protein